jgi:glyceraldehyde-3-phosphate dehydrogenase (NADP+)
MVMVSIQSSFLLVFYLVAVGNGMKASGSVCPVGPIAHSSVSPGDEWYEKRPYVDGGGSFIGGKINAYAGEVVQVTSPIIDSATGQRAVIGQMAQMGESDALNAVKSSREAWNYGQGVWPQMSASQRIAAIEKVVASLKQKRSEIINVLQWEIAKTTADAAAEFDRTMLFIEATLKAYRESDASSSWKTVNGILARVRRTAVGIVMCLAPFNYPMNEAYTSLIPALVMGNVLILKIPTLGGLAHILTMEAYAQHLPEGVINFVSGSGRVTMGPIMRSGAVDALAFIGGSAAADMIIKDHPNPHRLKLFLQLEGKNLGIVLPDADLDVAAEQVTIGSTTYNGQRCTAIKLVFVHESVAVKFLAAFVSKVSALKVGLPWEDKVLITPLPEPKKPAYLKELILDAVAKGAKVINAEQGGGTQSASLMTPAIVYPVTSAMRLWTEEQFGPVIPIATYSDIAQVHDYLAKTHYGQQAAVFTTNSAAAAPLLDVLSTAVGRININAQCARSPDVFPFSGRRSSALGTMSVTEGLNTFSIETVVATKDDGALNVAIVKGFETNTKFLAPL